MCAKLRAPREQRPGLGGTPVKTELSAEKLEQNTKWLLEGAANTLDSRLKGRMTSKEFFTLYNELIDRTVTAVDNWSRAGRTKKLSPLEIENEILSRTSEKIGKAIGEAITRRIARSFINLKRRIGEAGVKEKLPEIMEELQNGHGNLKKLLNNKKIGLADDEIRVILDVREGGLSKADVEMINFASKNEIVHKFFRLPKKMPEGVMAKAWRGMQWTVKNLVCPEAKKAVVRAYSAAATVKHPLDRAARDAMIEALGAKMDTHPKVTRHLRYKRYRIIPLAIVLAIYSLSSSEEEKQLEGEKPRITASAKGRKKRGPAEDALYKKAYIRHHRHKILDLMGEEGIPEEQRASAASVIATIPEDFFNEAKTPELRKMVSVFNDLSPLSGKIPKEKIGMAVYNILRFVSPSQSNDFAKALAKNAKSAKDIAAVFNNPPAVVNMTEEWLRRPFAEFKEAGFDTERDERVRLLCKAIRTTMVKKGRETVPLSADKQGEYAKVLASMYTPSRGRPRVPDTYQADLGFLAHLSGKGFSVDDSAEILATLKFVYKPGDLDKVADRIVKNLKPSMSEEEMRLVIEAPAFRNRGYANDAWEKSTDPRLRRVLTEGRHSKDFSKDLRQLPQNLYEDAIETLVSFTEAWQSERRVLKKGDITPLIGPIEAITRSKALSYLSPEERGRILYRIATSVKEKATVERKNVEPRSLAIKHINSAFKGQRPTEADVLDSIDAFLGENPGFAL